MWPYVYVASVFCMHVVFYRFCFLAVWPSTILIILFYFFLLFCFLAIWPVGLSVFMLSGNLKTTVLGS